MSKSKVKNLNRIRSFETAARLGGFAAAAESMGVTPAAVSQQIRSFETEYGVTLFERLPNRLILTNEGRSVLPRLVQALSLIDEAVGSISLPDIAGELNVNVAPSLATHWLMPRLHNFIDHYPHISLTVLSDEQPSQSTLDQIDLRLIHGVGYYPHIDSKLLTRETVFPVMSPELYHRHPVRTATDLRKHVLLQDVRVGESEASVQWSRWLEDIDSEFPRKSKNLYFGNYNLIIDAAKQGLGVALGRSVIVNDLLSSGDLIAPLNSSYEAEHAYYTVTTKLLSLSPRVITFRSWLSEQMSAMPDKLG